MKINFKSIIINSLFIGTIFALCIAGFDFANSKNFNIIKFTFNLFIFGIAMGLKDYYNLKK